VLASGTLAVGLHFSSSCADSIHDKRTSAQTPSKPNIVFILADDMRKDDLKYMPKTKAQLQDKGMTFQNAFVSNALCCPSRATIMRGQYSHNTGVWTNLNSSDGGWQAYKQKGHEKDNVATRLHSAGYRTALFGKYLNYYTETTNKPPGWDRWFATFETHPYHYFDYSANDQGTIRHYGTDASDYKTDVISRKANTFIGNSASRGEPFFAYVAPPASHEPFTPAPRDAHAYDGAKAPRLPSFNERDVSDKPSWMRKLPRLTSDQIAEIDERHEARAETLQALDDLVEGIVEELENAGVMDNTYIFFTSDTGFFHGEHRIPSQKLRPYEEDIRVPLLVRGPGVAAGHQARKLALNTDYLPTFTNLAGAQSPPYVDGRSLRPVLKGNAASWRDAVLLEAAAYYSPAYYGIRTTSTNSSTQSKYVEYEGGARELYNLESDGYELTNSYDAAAPPNALAARLQALKGCGADAALTCRKAEDGP
jgi:N-acetylglucosamine-6-sulfatase